MSIDGEIVTKQMCETFYCLLLVIQLIVTRHEGLGQILSTRWGRES